MENLINLDDFIKIGGDYSPLKIVKKHFWGWECEYSLYHPSAGERIVATVALYRYGGRYIISDKHFYDNVPFFKNIAKVFKQDPPYKRELNIGRAQSIAFRHLCSFLIFLFRIVIPAYELVRGWVAFFDGDSYTPKIRLCICLLSVIVACLISFIRIWLYGLGAQRNSDLDFLLKGGD